MAAGDSVMEFGHPQVLNGLYALPLAVLLFAYGARQRAAVLRRFTGERMTEALAPGRSWRRNLLKATLKTTALALLIVAAARPQFGTQLTKVHREGIDLVIALDTSLSMLAEDMKPNRLERAKQEIVDLIQGLKGDRVGIVAFAGDAFVLCPLTVDYSAALMFTKTADVDVVSQQGTALQGAIETSLALFKESSPSDKVIILVTDGESHEGDPVKLAREAKERGIRIYTIGIGNPAGELIPLRGTDGSIEGYKKDKSGQTVMTRLDERVLREVAGASGGQYLPATRDGLELKVLYRDISGLQRSAIEGEFVERKTDRFQWFIAAAFLLLVFETLLTRRSGSPGTGVRRVLHSGAVGIVALIVIAIAGNASARGVDGKRVNSGNRYFESGEYEKALSLYEEAHGDTTRHVDLPDGLLYNEGNALHMLERYKEALEKYHTSFSDDSTQAGRMLYNRGNTLLRMSKVDEAIESYVESLAYAPDDEDARHNLELALRMRQKQQQQQQQQQKQKQKQKQKKDDQDKSKQQQGENDQQQNDQDQEQNRQQQQQQQDNQQQQQEQKQDQQSQSPDSTQANQPSEMDSTNAQPQQSIQLTREDALRILRLLEEKEQELQKEKRKAAIKRAARGKDW
jgi:Ca-activated chloride channel family protein